MPGFDEVSFRAQTYMRTIWDLFQTCARLLPNYIVAVRPFEDRSTIFYGKPHWLYTSGIVPVTTGYPGDEKAAELGIIPPMISEPDFDLADIITNMNKNITPYADAEAFLRGTEPLETYAAMVEQQGSSSGIFGTAGHLRDNKIVIDMDSDYSQYAHDQGVIPKWVARLPVKSGNVTVGFHLPIISDGGTKHSQIPQLPSRYRYPFFASRTENENKLDKFSYQYGDSETYGGAHGFSAAYGVKTVTQRYGEEFAALLFVDAKFQSERGISNTIIDEILSNSLDFSSPMDNSIELLETVTMPFPEKPKEGNSDLFEFQVKNDFYHDWEPPKSEIDEQFYIAMRWPYKPSLISDDALNKFADKYDLGDLYGEAKDYQNQHILVYNPSAGKRGFWSRCCL